MAGPLPPSSEKPDERLLLQGPELITAALLLALSNFIVVLDTTIANVSVPHIAGGLAVAPNQGTYVITSYAVAEAIIVPLTGWLAARFGTVRVFATSMLLFGFFSFLCGLAESLGALVMFRIFQGLAGGPLIPLSQTLLMKIFPREKMGVAMALWSMTTLIAPICGPILGGYISDNIGWPYIFFINIPIALLCGLLTMRMLAHVETPTRKTRIDKIGLVLLIVWVAALQIMLDKGKELDWFESPFITVMAIIASIGFAAFVIWELTDEHPVVDLRVFRHRAFSMSTITICLAFGSFFATAVLTPLWLQTQMGYTAITAGMATGMTGILAVFIAPFAAKMLGKTDERYMVCFGLFWLGIITLARGFYTTDVTFWGVALPILALGIGMPFFMIPISQMALRAVPHTETASAAGLFSFARTISCAFATSIVTTAWDKGAENQHALLAGSIDATGSGYNTLINLGFSNQQALSMLDNMLTAQSVMLSTNHMFQMISATFLLAIMAMLLSPKSQK